MQCAPCGQVSMTRRPPLAEVTVPGQAGNGTKPCPVLRQVGVQPQPSLAGQLAGTFLWQFGRSSAPPLAREHWGPRWLWG